MKLRALEISEVNSYIKRVLTNDAILYNLKVKGEISNFKVHSSGNVYLSLKDEKSKINCVIFKSNYNKDLQVDNGSKVIAHGYISLYERDGSYQLYINDIEIEGLGDLYIEFNKLKEQLSKEGLFDVKYKKTIPKIPKSIGVITSETGAVIRDIINVIKRRYPKVNIKLYPVKVQGQQSKYDICEGIKFFNKEFERNWFNICLVFLSIIVLVLTYKYTPVAYNTDINDKNAMIELSKYDLNSISGKKKKKSYKEVVEKHKGANISDFKQYYIWTQDASSYLESLFYAGKVHPSNTRGKQFFYSYKLFSLADYRYKLFGVGYLNQDALLAIESDFFMAIFDFGILGFLLFLFIPIKEFIKALMFIVKNLKRVDLETYMLFMGLGIFFCISIYAGYTYIYTNFSIFLVLLIVMLKLKIDIICIDDKKSIKSISFLGLHLGYGGIESSIINAANALSKKYDVEIISFYKLAEDQNKNVNSKVKIKYLYNGGPNLDKITLYRNNKQVLRLFGELVKALWILLLKRILVIREIRRCRSDAIVSTRVEFNLLLDNFGRESTLKIAQEHCYHNDNKKYINKIKSYHNLDYLCALTTTLKADYKRFLENSHSRVKVVLLPNMLVSLPKKKSPCNKKNLITVSRLDYGKRNDEIIEMFSKIDDKDAKLYIIGDGEEYERLEKLIADLKLEDRVKLLGYMSHKDMEKYLFDSSIFLMASVTEGLPMVLLEAMSYGIPCIAYKTASGTSDIIDNEYNGYIIENRDSDEYIKDINTLLDNDKLRMKYSKNAILTSKKFYKDEVVKMWEKLLK